MSFIVSPIGCDVLIGDLDSSLPNYELFKEKTIYIHTSGTYVRTNTGWKLIANQEGIYAELLERRRNNFPANINDWISLLEETNDNM